MRRSRACKKSLLIRACTVSKLLYQKQRSKMLRNTRQADSVDVTFEPRPPDVLWNNSDHIAVLAHTSNTQRNTACKTSAVIAQEGRKSQLSDQQGFRCRNWVSFESHQKITSAGTAISSNDPTSCNSSEGSTRSSRRKPSAAKPFATQAQCSKAMGESSAAGSRWTFVVSKEPLKCSTSQPLPLAD